VVEDNTSAFHDFRFAQAANSGTVYVWRDNVYYGTDAGISSAALAMWFGDGSGAGGGPSIQLDYFRWDSTGAYAPVGQVANIAGDLNHDGLVNLTDYGVLTSHWMQPVFGASNGDLNGDGTVNISDFAQFKLDYQSFNGGGAGAELAVPTPEPGTLALVAAALPALYFAWRRKRRAN